MQCSKCHGGEGAQGIMAQSRVREGVYLGRVSGGVNVSGKS